MTQVIGLPAGPLTAVSFPPNFQQAPFEPLQFFSDLAPPFRKGLLAQLVQSAALTGQRSLVRAQYNPHQAENPRLKARVFSFPRRKPSWLALSKGRSFKKGQRTIWLLAAKGPPDLLRSLGPLFAEGRLHLVHRHPTKADGGNPVCEIPNSKFQIPNPKFQIPLDWGS